MSVDDCERGEMCSLGRCRPTSGKVLLNSVTIKTESCTGCSQESEGVVVRLVGQRDKENPNGYKCTTAPLNHQDQEDFTGGGGVARFSGDTREEERMMGGCARVSILITV